ncbi:MAG: CheR family methyltransferase [Gallionella sp.]
MPDNAVREFHFTAQDFQLISKLIHQRAGISLTASKQELVYSRVARRLRATGIKTFAEYLDRLQRGDAAEWQEFTNSLTTNLTSFFREEHHFQILAGHLRNLGKTRPIVLWCSACSTGEEAYSLAMTAADTFSGFDNPVRIVASDLDTRVLEVARAGRYKLETVAKMPAQQIDKFFLRGKDESESYVQVRPELQSMITFRQINLLDLVWPIRGQLDAIFCRNVMIYFDKATQLAILKKFAPLMRSDGLLFAGHSENLVHADAYFKLRARTVYQLSGDYRTPSR